MKEVNGDLVRKRRDPRTKEQPSLPGDETRTVWVQAEVPGIVLAGSLSISLRLSPSLIYSPFILVVYYLPSIFLHVGNSDLKDTEIKSLPSRNL